MTTMLKFSCDTCPRRCVLYEKLHHICSYCMSTLCCYLDLDNTTKCLKYIYYSWMIPWQLKDIVIEYTRMIERCIEVFNLAWFRATQAAALQQNEPLDVEENVYLCLMKVLLALSPTEGSKIAIEAAEHHFDRIDAMAFLALLPPTTPVAMLQTFLTKSIQFGNAKNRNLQVIYQLLRVREVNLRTSENQE